MKQGVLKTSLALIAALMIVATPVVVSAQNPVLEAKTTAESEVSKGLWFAAGCVLGLVGVIIAYFYEPEPPAEALMGKSPKYVALFTNAYKKAAKHIQTKYALYGLVTDVVLYCVFYLAYFVIFASAASAAAGAAF